MLAPHNVTKRRRTGFLYGQGSAEGNTPSAQAKMLIGLGPTEETRHLSNGAASAGHDNLIRVEEVSFRDRMDKNEVDPIRGNVHVSLGQGVLEPKVHAVPGHGCGRQITEVSPRVGRVGKGVLS